MKGVLRVAAMCLLLSGLTWAAPPQCRSTTLAHYISLGASGCTFGGIVFANFKYSGSAKGGAALIKASQITVDPTEIPTRTASFRFSAAWSVSGEQSQKSKIKYTASLPNGDTVQSDLGLTLGTAQIGALGAVTVNEGSNVGSLQVSESCNEITCQTRANDNLLFNPVSVVMIEEDVSLKGSLGATSLDEFDSSVNLCAPCA